MNLPIIKLKCSALIILSILEQKCVRYFKLLSSYVYYVQCCDLKMLIEN